MKISRSSHIPLSLLAAAALGTPISTSAQVQMRYSHFVPPTHSTFSGLHAWANSIEHASAGQLRVKIFPAEQLGKAKDHFDMVRDGVADAGWVVPGYTPGRFPIVTLLELPFMAKNADGGSLAFDTWYRRYAAAELKGVHYCLGFLQDPGVLHSRKVVKTPEDIRGLKLRSPTVPMGDFFNLLGANSVAIPAPQVRESIERGTIDGAAFAWRTAITLGVSKATPYHLDAPIYTVPVVYLLNKNFYAKLTPPLKKVMDAHCTPQWGQKIGVDWAAHEAAGRSVLASDREHSVVKLTDAQAQSWRRAARPLMLQWRETVVKSGTDADAALAQLQDLLKRNGAEY